MNILQEKKRRKKQSIKETISKFLKKVLNQIKKIFNEFMNLPDHIRKIIYVWLIIILIFILLAIISSSNNNYLDKYKQLENDMNISALDYVKSNEIIPGEENKLRLDLNVLVDFNFLYEEKVFDKTCEGFSLIYYHETEEDYKISSYLKCKKYTTKGYSDYK